jgi:predicted phage-related endonuclease
MTVAGVSAPLDDNARNELREYVHASEQIEMWEERKRKARDALVAFLAVRQADEGTIEEKTVCRYGRTVRESVDTKRLREEEPAMARRFTRSSVVETFRLVGK